MKKLLSSVALSILALSSLLTAPVQAATSTGTFNTAVNLTSACVVSTGNADMVFNYTSFGAVINPSTTLQIKCTNTLPYTLALSSTNTVAGTTTVLGLAYTLAMTGTGTTGGGTGVNKPVVITGTMAAGQSGTCGTTAICSATETHTLTVTY